MVEAIFLNFYGTVVFEEDTLFINDDKVELIGSSPYYIFGNGVVEGRKAGFKLCR